MTALTQTMSSNTTGTAWGVAKNSTHTVTGYVNMIGDFGGGTLSWGSRPIGSSGSYATVNGMSAFTASAGGQFEMSPGVEYAPTLTGSSGSPSIVITLSRPND